MKALDRLAKIATELDEHQLYKEADIVTSIMKRIAQETPQEVVDMAPSFNSVGEYDSDAWKSAFADKYNRFLQQVKVAKDPNTPTPQNAKTVAQGLYDEMMYMASNYLKDDPEVFNIMKWVAPTYKGLFS